MADCFKTLVESLPFPIIIHMQDRALFANHACAKLFGYNRAEDILSLKSIAYTLGKDGDKDCATYYRNDGSIVECEQMHFPIMWNSFSAECLILSVAKKEDLLTHKIIKQSYEDASNSRSRFLAAVSHEMRTPLNALINLSHLLRTTDLDQHQDEMVVVAQNSAQELLDRIQDVLEYSQLESGQIEQALEPCVIANIVEPVLELLKFDAQKKSLSLNINIEPSLKQSFMASTSAIRRIIRHLGENAINYTLSGSVDINIATGEDNRGIIIKISDTGIGMSDEKISKIFQPFVFDIDPVNRSIGGLSLGLALTRAIVRSLGGELSISHNEPNGIIAYVYLPFELEAIEIDSQEIHESDEHLNILVAEDNKTNQKVVSLILDQLGHKVTIADDGEKCVEALKVQNFDLILMDLHMPFMDGYEASRRIRQSGNDIPIFALTADARVEARKAAIEAGMDGFLTKPLMVGELHAALSEVAHFKAQNSQNNYFG